MKLLKSKLQRTKEVEYFGLALTVPGDARHIATDNDGSVYAGIDKPETFGNYWLFKDGYYLIAFVDLECMDWKDTLVEL